MIRVALILFLFITSIFANTITIAVATNVSYAMNDLKKEFHKLYPNTKIRVILGSSGKLTAQIRHSAPYEMFLSANMKYPIALYKEKIAITKPVVYAKGALILFSRKKLNFSKGINLLKDKNIRRIAIANPKTAPYGKASLEALKNAKIYENIKHKLIFAEGVSQTLSYTMTAVDVGFVAKSSVYSPKMKRFKKGLNWQEVDKTFYNPINQGIVILKRGENSQDVKNFYKFMLSQKAKEILKRYGYLI